MKSKKLTKRILKIAKDIQTSWYFKIEEELRNKGYFRLGEKPHNEVTPIEIIVVDKGLPYINFLEKMEITIPREWIERYSKKGNMNKNDLIYAILTHEYAHALFHPRDMERFLEENVALYFLGANSKTRKVVINRFDDLVANLKIWQRNIGKELKELYRKIPGRCVLDKLEKRVYELVTGEDFGIGKDKEVEEYAKKITKEIYLLSGNPIKTVDNCKKEISLFYTIIKDLLRP